MKLVASVVGDSDVDGNFGSVGSATVVEFGKAAVTSGDCDTACATVFGNKALFSTGEEPKGAAETEALRGFGRCRGVTLVVRQYDSGGTIFGSCDFVTDDLVLTAVVVDCTATGYRFSTLNIAIILSTLGTGDFCST